MRKLMSMMAMDGGAVFFHLRLAGVKLDVTPCKVLVIRYSGDTSTFTRGMIRCEPWY